MNRFFNRTILTFGSLHNLTFTRLVRIDEYAKFLNDAYTHMPENFYFSHHSFDHYITRIIILMKLWLKKSRHYIRLKSKNANFE